MDINCVASCANQQEGKCTLYELPAAPAQAVSGAQQKGCFYYKQPSRDLQMG